MVIPTTSPQVHNFLCFIAASLLVFWGLRILLKFKNIWRLYSALKQPRPRVLWFHSMGLADLRDILLSLGSQLQPKHLKQLLQSALAAHDVSPLHKLFVKFHVDLSASFKSSDGAPKLFLPIDFLEDVLVDSLTVDLFFGVNRNFFEEMNRRLEGRLRQASNLRRSGSPRSPRSSGRSGSLFGTGKKKLKGSLDFDPNMMYPGCLCQSHHTFDSGSSMDASFESKQSFEKIEIEIEEKLSSRDLHQLNDMDLIFCVAVVSIPHSDQFEYTVLDGNWDGCETTFEAYASLARVKTQYVLDLQQVIFAEYEGVYGCDSLEENQEDNVCVVCYVKPKGAMLLPCRHLCVCDECLPKIDKCPLCRKPMVENIQWKTQSHYRSLKMDVDEELQ